MYFFFNDTTTTGIYTLALHDALPFCDLRAARPAVRVRPAPAEGPRRHRAPRHRPRAHPRVRARAVPEGRPMTAAPRSEEHTSELQSRHYLVCRLLLAKK